MTKILFRLSTIILIYLIDEQINQKWKKIFAHVENNQRRHFFAFYALSFKFLKHFQKCENLLFVRCINTM